MKGIVQFLGIIIGVVGLILIFYSVNIQIPFNGTITVFPYQIVGAIVLLIGFVTFVIGVAIPEEKGTTALREAEETGQVKLTKFTGEIDSEDMTCGSCAFFGNPIVCPYKEKNAKAEYCISYRSRKTSGSTDGY